MWRTSQTVHDDLFVKASPQIDPPFCVSDSNLVWSPTRFPSQRTRTILNFFLCVNSASLTRKKWGHIFRNTPCRLNFVYSKYQSFSERNFSRGLREPVLCQTNKQGVSCGKYIWIFSVDRERFEQESNGTIQGPNYSDEGGVGEVTVSTTVVVVFVFVGEK